MEGLKKRKGFTSQTLTIKVRLVLFMARTGLAITVITRIAKALNMEGGRGGMKRKWSYMVGPGDTPEQGQITGKIKWRRLKAIAERVAQRKVEIHCSTDALNDNIRAATQYSDELAHIVINLKEVKSAKDVIAAISHELAHIVLDTDQEDETFNQKWVEIERLIIRRYRGGVEGEATD